MVAHDENAYLDGVLVPIPSLTKGRGAVSSAENVGSGKGRWSWRRCRYE